MRWWHWLRAFLGGYFWLPCVLCGRKYGGHERLQGHLMLSWSQGKSTCPKCAVEAERLNQEFIKNHPFPTPIAISRAGTENRGEFGAP